MPQRIHYSRAIHLDFSSDAILQRPKLAPYVAAIPMHWNDIEARIAIFVAALLGAEAKTVITIFLSLKGDGPRRALIDAVTAMHLDKDQLKWFKDVQKSIGKRYDERNRAVHGTWGISEEYPDKLLWHDLRDSTAMAPDMFALSGKANTAARRARLLEEQRKSLVYSEQDFQQILKRFRDTFDELKFLTREHIDDRLR